MSKRKENDFFNLGSSDESDDEEQGEAVKSKEAEISKWDWDREENFHLYYKTHWENPGVSKRPYEDDIPSSSKKLAKEDESSNEARIESSVGDSGYLLKLVGHHASVNRIHWAKATPNMLLSSSMDG